MTITPAPMLACSLYCRRTRPIAVALAPSATNTSEKPRTKDALSASVNRRACRGWSCASSTASPAMYERYAGTSGRTHGDRNEIAPAASAAMLPTPGVAIIAYQFDNGRVHERTRCCIDFLEQPFRWKAGEVEGSPFRGAVLDGSTPMCPRSSRHRFAAHAAHTHPARTRDTAADG